MTDDFNKTHQRILQLREEILHHNEMYYAQANSEITDDAWDALFQELNHLEAQNPQWLSPTSPTQTVGAKVSGNLEKVRRQHPMMSLDKALTPGEIIEFVNKTKRFLANENEFSFYTMPKFDGAAIELVYEKGRLILATTRGDGFEGENVTA
ncbi:MAG: DNA ligase LigA-related protein, partial [Candidatus Adiutrix sp.]